MKFGAKRFPLVIAPCSLFMSQSSLLLQSPISTSARSLSLSYMVHKIEIAFFSTSIKFLSWRWFLEKNLTFELRVHYSLLVSVLPETLSYPPSFIMRAGSKVVEVVFAFSIIGLFTSYSHHFILIDLKLAIFIFLFLNYYYSGSLCTWY